MDLLTKINECNDDELENIIKKQIEEVNQNANKVSTLGFDDSNKLIAFHRGFIPLETRIKYSQRAIETYSMQTTDYFYEFARLLKKNGIKSKGQLVVFIEPFLNSYFGIPYSSVDNRSKIFYEIAWNTTETDKDFFQRLEQNEIGDLKGKKVAMCTEYGAIAQNLLTIFGFDTYYCMGCILNDNKEDAHCFNIVLAKEAYMLLDYSMPCPMISNGSIVSHLPFQGKIKLEELKDVLENNFIKEYPMYQWIRNRAGYKKEATGKMRNYLVGKLSFEQKTPVLK